MAKKVGPNRVNRTAKQASKPPSARHSRTTQPSSLKRLSPLQKQPTKGRASDGTKADQSLLTSIIENIPHMIFVKDARTLKFVRFNQAGEQLLGYPREELIGKSDYDFFSKQEADFFTTVDRQVLQRGQILDIPEEPIDTRQKGRRLLHTKKVPIHNDKGIPQYLLGISEDITERKQIHQAERERARALEQQQIALCELATHNAISTGHLDQALQLITETGARALDVERASIWILNEPQKTLELLDLYERTPNRHTTGVTLAAQDFPSYFQAITHEEYAIAAHDAYTDSRTREFSQSYLTPLGIGALLDAPIRRKGHLIGVLCHEHVGKARSWTKEETLFSSSLATYITLVLEARQRREAEEALVIAKNAAEVANLAKSEFLASVSHEIRTPMNAIIGMADLLWETNLTPDQRKYLRIFRRAGSTLLHLINDILDLSKVEAGHIELESIEFDLSDLIERVIEILAMQANEKGIELAYHLAPDVSCALIGDPTRLRQILINLISNAIKFTDQGSVVVEITNDPDHQAPGLIRFSVTDTGIGIPPDKLATIFESFTQAHTSTTRKYGGTGLGLTISKQLIDLMNGKIWVESTLGEGCTFHCMLQLRIAPRKSGAPSTTPIDLQHIRTLVVDDHQTNRKILTETLSGWNAQVTDVANGHDALTELRRATEAAQPYRLLLLDCRMPGMDGFQVVEELQRSASFKDLTVIMLASDRWTDDIARTYDMGLGGYLTKPIKRSDLLQTVSIALDRARGLPIPQAYVAPAVPVSARPLHILLVEDSPDNQVLVRSYLKQTGHQLEVAEHGGIAVEQFKKGHFDLILMDMNMPVMDGYEATKTIRAWELDHDLPRTPIIALTALALKQEGEKILKAGCSAHMTKPVKKQTLLEVLQACGAQRQK